MQSNIVEDLIEWIEYCIYDSKKIKIDMVAHKSGYSLRHVHEVFKREVGITIGKYIRLRRITLAALLVRFTRKSIFDISIDLNFGSQQAFNRTFIKQFKCTPLEYRTRDFFNTAELLPPYSSRYTELEIHEEAGLDLYLQAQEYQYEDYIIGERNQLIRSIKYDNIMEILRSHEYAYVASDLTCLKKIDSSIGVTSFVGFKVESGKENVVHISHDKSATVMFTGTWEEYKKLSRWLYVNSSFSRVDGFDIEIFSLQSPPSQHDPVFNAKICIPVK